jgi:hypothetical protein
MLHPGNFVRLIVDGQFDCKVRRVLARIALNALIDPQNYPVDLSEVNELENLAGLAVWGFLAYMANNPFEYGNHESLYRDQLLAQLNNPTVQTVEICDGR